jgi:hypothetical protein
MALLILAIGVPAAGIVAVSVSLPAGGGVLAGALLAWVNLRWLRQALDALVVAATAGPDAPRPRISTWIFVKLFGRYALIVVVSYVIVVFLSVPAISIVGGLCALAAAAMAESLYEIFTYKH